VHLESDAVYENTALLSFVLTSGSYVRIRTGEPIHSFEDTRRGDMAIDQGNTNSMRCRVQRAWIC
jgi:hypothetical protein